MTDGADRPRETQPPRSQGASRPALSPAPEPERSPGGPPEATTAANATWRHQRVRALASEISTFIEFLGSGFRPGMSPGASRPKFRHLSASPGAETVPPEPESPVSGLGRRTPVPDAGAGAGRRWFSSRTLRYSIAGGPTAIHQTLSRRRPVPRHLRRHMDTSDIDLGYRRCGRPRTVVTARARYPRPARTRHGALRLLHAWPDAIRPHPPP
jgi:hypothetical protein